MSSGDDAVDDARNEYRTLYGSDPDEKFQMLLARVWRDGYGAGLRDRADEILQFIKEIR